MERLTSRKNEHIRRIRALSSDAAARRAAEEFVCDGGKLLSEALAHGAAVTEALWSVPPTVSLPGVPQYSVPPELLDYASPLRHASDVVFTARIPVWEPAPPGRALVLETVQDPGNLGTILRTANALGMDTVILTGSCADQFSPKTVRAGMGAVFRQRVYEMELAELRDYLARHGAILYGAALSPRASDLRSVCLQNAAVAVGSEGRGLSRALLEICGGEIVIPMRAGCESLNAAVAAAILMWELTRG